MAAAVVLQAAGKQSLDDVERFGQPLVPFNHARPALADDMLVQALAGAQPKREAAVAEQAHGRRRLGDDCRMVAHDRASHRRHEPEIRGGLHDRAQNRPSERRMRLLLEPGKEMVGDRGKLEAGLLGTPRIA